MCLSELFQRLFGRNEPTQTPNHLHYDSLTAWATDIGLPENWAQHPDTIQRALWLRQYSELKQHLWEGHIATLTSEEQQQFANGTHPSLDHKYAKHAFPFCSLLEADLASRGVSSVVKVGFYHMNRIILSAYLAEMPNGGLPNDPWLFRGFEVKAMLATKPLEEYRDNQSFKA